MKYVLVMRRNNFTGEGQWFRAFGPFDSRGKANTFKRKQIRHLYNEGYSSKYVEDNFAWKIMQIWTPEGMPYDYTEGESNAKGND